jgi:anthranilate synthase/phosphoribosyltransferase
MILLIDNYDSFTYNIYQYLREMNFDVVVKRNDAITIQEIEKMKPLNIIISPGPGRPESAGITLDIIKTFKGIIPILGICLGHQAIGAAFGGKVIRADHIYHGKPSQISHDGRGCFNGIKTPLTAIRYHSLVVEKISLPRELEVSALSEDGDIMALRHRQYSIEGVQFHPESIGTSFGKEILENFLQQKREKPTIQSSIKKVFSGDNLSEEEAFQVMNDITSGSATPAQIAGLLTAISMKGESVSELTGFVRVMREKAVAIKKPEGKKLVDTCGTGGDGSHSFNISTVSAFVAAGAGVTIAKHGNRSVTSRCGSADVLEALGVNISVYPEIVSQALDKIGISFLFARNLHTSMKYAAPVRAELGVRTAFNILGPMSNPAGAEYQLLGVFNNEIRDKMAKVLVNLGVKRAMIVHGYDGLDEITLTGKTWISEVDNGWIKNYSFDPSEYNFQYCNSEDIRGGNLKTNAEIALAILNGEKGPKRDIVILNAAAAIYISEMADSFEIAIQMAGESIDSGLAMKKLDELIQVSCSH